MEERLLAGWLGLQLYADMGLGLSPLPALLAFALPPSQPPFHYTAPSVHNMLSSALCLSLSDSLLRPSTKVTPGGCPEDFGWKQSPLACPCLFPFPFVVLMMEATASYDGQVLYTKLHPQLFVTFYFEISLLCSSCPG